MALASFLAGVLVGVLLVAAAVAATAYSVIRTSRPASATGAAKGAAPSDGLARSATAAAAAGAGTAEWPPAVVKTLRALLIDPTVPETCAWFNAFLIRYWLELRVSMLYKERMMRNLAAKLRRKLDTSLIVRWTARARRPGVVPVSAWRANATEVWVCSGVGAGARHGTRQSDVDISDLTFGDFPPHIQRVQLVRNTEINEELLVVRQAVRVLLGSGRRVMGSRAMCARAGPSAPPPPPSARQMIDFDLEYKGGMALTIEVEVAAINVLVPVTVTITEIVGRVRSPIPPRPASRHGQKAPGVSCGKHGPDSRPMPVQTHSYLPARDPPGAAALTGAAAPERNRVQRDVCERAQVCPSGAIACGAQPARILGLSRPCRPLPVQEAASAVSGDVDVPSVAVLRLAAHLTADLRPCAGCVACGGEQSVSRACV